VTERLPTFDALALAAAFQVGLSLKAEEGRLGTKIALQRAVFCSAESNNGQRRLTWLSIP
jgi:hypothetical protein